MRVRSSRQVERRANAAEWQTRGVIVTRRVTPAAFTDCEDVLFRTINDVGDIVNGGDT